MEDIVEFLFKGIFRFIRHIILDLIFEFAIKGPGYLIVRLYTKKNEIDVDGWEVVVWGIVCWVAIGFLVYAVGNM